MSAAQGSPLDSPPLDGRIATGLHKLGLALKHQEWSHANEHGLSPTQGQILSLLAAEGTLTASEVGERLGIGLPTISEAVTTLAAKGLVRRTPDERHPRARLLRLTPAGRRLSVKTRGWAEFLTQAVGALTLVEQATLLTALMKMIRTLQEEGQIPVQRMCVTCTHFRPHVRDGDTPYHCAFVDAPTVRMSSRSWLTVTSHLPRAWNASSFVATQNPSGRNRPVLDGCWSANGGRDRVHCPLYRDGLHAPQGIPVLSASC